MEERHNASRYRAVDLFSGAGGLSVGLKRAGFSVVGAVENYTPAVETYKRNHRSTSVFQEDIRDVLAEKITGLTSDGKIDLIAGCPPCQGFSSLTHKYKNNADSRNDLVLEMSRLVRDIGPSVVMMENVPGLASRGKRFFDHFVGSLEEEGYVVTSDVLQVADYGVPQMRRRLVLLAGKGFRIELPETTHSQNGGDGKKKWRSLKDAIGDMGDPTLLSESFLSGGPRAYDWHVVRNVSETTRRRLRALSAGASRANLPDELRPECHKGRNKGFTNVYGRMAWDKPSVTITAGCTTLSKGRFGHPEKERTISLREAALLQTFPKRYDFVTDFMEVACTLVGNALPCDFAEILAAQCIKALIARHN